MRLRTVHSVLVAIAFVLLFAAEAPAQTPDSNSKKSAQAKASQQSTTNQQNAGEQKFARNCSRCHRSPEGFSPRISSTILKHMRVRASLSEKDEQEILHFLNP